MSEKEEKTSSFSEGTTIFFYENSPKDIELHWVNNNLLQITYTDPTCLSDRWHTERKEKQWRGVQITYKDKCSKDNKK